MSDFQINTDDLKQWLTLSQLVARYFPIVTENKIRHQLRDRRANGLDEFVCRAGKHLLIHEQGYSMWLRRRK